MGITKQLSQYMEKMKKFRMPALVLLIGLLLMAIPIDQGKEPVSEDVEATDKAVSMEKQLEQLLSQIQGVGDVSVLLSVGVGEERVFHTDEDSSINGESRTERNTTVIIDSNNNLESPLVSKVISPQYSGAVIACHGADSPSVRLAVVDAVSKITGLGADRISVLKMK